MGQVAVFVCEDEPLSFCAYNFVCVRFCLIPKLPCERAWEWQVGWYTSLIPRPIPKEGRGPGIHCLRMLEMFPYTTIKLFGARVKQCTCTYTLSSERSVLLAACIYEIENALQDLRISSEHKIFNNLIFCPWHEPRLAYMHKRA